MWPDNKNPAELLIRLAKTAADKFLDTALFPCAVIAANDAVARGIYNSFSENAVKIPEQAVIAGIDNDRSINRGLIASVYCAPEKTGFRAAKLLIEKNAEMRSGKIYNLALPPALSAGITLY
ncbi:MAG TPA: hypothetical protein DC049_02475 [Spirochaetia bacterium]|nr:hypothetical protein [Spirochaetia bacterium]